MRMKWPTLISISTATTGIGMALFPFDHLLRHGSFTGAAADCVAFALAIVAIVAFIVLSFFIYLARSWARHALIVALICSIVAVLISVVSQKMQGAGGDALYWVAICMIVLTPPFFTLGVLFQPDVSRSFTALPNEPAPNT
jgi:membrane protein CcdC involved in cytochrome C biogenesis